MEVINILNFKILDNKKDLKKFVDIAAFSFSIPISEKEKYLERHESLFEEGKKYCTAFDESKLICGFNIHDLNMTFRGAPMKTGGIGDVCSRNDCRGKGGISFVFDNALKYMKENNFILSALYPFNFNFYRKYGYEIFTDSTSYDISSSTLYFEKNNEDIIIEEMDFPDEETKIYYNEFASKNYNLVQRDDINWKNSLRNFFSTEIKSGIVKFKQNNLMKGLIRYFYKNINGKNKLIIKDLIFSDENIKKSIFSYIKSLSYQISDLSILVPSDFLIWPYLGDYPKQKTSGGNCMIRIIDIEKLNDIKFISQDTSINIEIIDHNCSWNNGIWSLTVNDNRLYIEKTSKAHIKTDIGTLSSILSGFTNIKDMISVKRIETIDYNDQDFNLYNTFISEPF
jgi:predicted acetyltransferase